MKSVLRMPLEERTRSALDYQTQYMNLDCMKYSPQRKTRAEIKGKRTRRTSSRGEQTVDNSSF